MYFTGTCPVSQTPLGEQRQTQKLADLDISIAFHDYNSKLMPRLISWLYLRSSNL
jgi:hypothetical protein